MTLAFEMKGAIGVFDSGVGGLTVVRTILQAVPNANVVFVADQAHVPYGGRPLYEVAKFAQGISEALIASGAAAVVMACNISTATALSAVVRSNPEHIVLGVIGPGARGAVSATKTGNIGVLATEGTVRTGEYTRCVHSISSDVKVTEVACPLFVPLIESGETGTRQAFTAAAEYLDPILKSGADTVILGCTHYPFLLECLQTVAPSVTFIDPACITALDLRDRLAARNSHEDLSTSNMTIMGNLVTTGDLQVFAAQVSRFIPEIHSRFKLGRGGWMHDKLVLSYDPISTAERQAAVR